MGMQADFMNFCDGWYFTAFACFSVKAQRKRKVVFGRNVVAGERIRVGIRWRNGRVSDNFATRTHTTLEDFLHHGAGMAWESDIQERPTRPIA